MHCRKSLFRIRLMPSMPGSAEILSILSSESCSGVGRRVSGPSRPTRTRSLHQASAANGSYHIYHPLPGRKGCCPFGDTKPILNQPRQGRHLHETESTASLRSRTLGHFSSHFSHPGQLKIGYQWIPRDHILWLIITFKSRFLKRP